MRTWLVALFLMAALPSLGAQPNRFNYQALLRDGDGALLEGQHTLHVGLYEGGSAGVAGSGDLLYGETAIVTAVDGVVNHVIGAGTPTGDPLDADDLATSATVFVQIAVDLPANVVLPRTPLQSVPYAVQAASAESANSALNGVPSGTMILGTSPNAPAGFTSLETTLFAPWQSRAHVPTPRYIAAAAAVGGKLHVIGGTYGSNVGGVNEVYSPATNEWTTATEMPTPRVWLTCTELGGLIYAVGGNRPGFGVIPTTESYDPVGNAWSPRQQVTMEREKHSAAALNGRLYVCGGRNNNGDIITSVEEYNPGTDGWVTKASMLTTRSHTAAAAAQGKVYVMGGFTETTVTAVNEEYDPVGNVWTPKAPMPFALYVHKAVSHAGRIYVTGGENSALAISAEVLIYDPASDTWTVGPPLPSPRANASSALVGNLLYVVGGTFTPGVFIPDTFAWPPGVYYPYVKD